MAFTQLRQLPAGYLGQQHLATMAFNTYVIGAGRADPMPEGFTYADLFRPAFWAHHVTGPHALRAGDLINVRDRNGAYDVFLRVTAVPKGGAVVEFVFGREPEGAAAVVAGDTAADAATEARTVPFLPDGRPAIRTEHTRATKWRVIALDGSEHSSGYDTDAIAREAMLKYVGELKMIYPSDEEVAAKAAEAKVAAEKRKTEARIRQHASTKHPGMP